MATTVERQGDDVGETAEGEGEEEGEGAERSSLESWWERREVLAFRCERSVRVSGGSR